MHSNMPCSPGRHFGHDVNWDRFPEASLWRSGDGLTWTDDIPICYHSNVPPRALNTSSFMAAVAHYGLATTYCSWPDVGDPK